MPGNDIRRMGRRIAVFGFLAVTLGACTDPDFYADHRDGVSFHGGDAVASNIAKQTIDPWPAGASNRNIDGNGERTQKAIERYRPNKIIAPQGMNTTSVLQTNSGSTAPASTPNQ